MRAIARRAVLLAAGLSLVACGGAESPAASTPATAVGASLACRNYATSFGTSVLDLSGASMGTSTCTFDPASLALQCTRLTTGSGCSNRATTSFYASVADFVEEATVVGRSRVLRTEAVSSGNCTGSTSTTVYTYDAEKRVVRIELHQDGLPVGSTTVTAWDGLGRPLRDLLNGAGCVDRPSTIVYDDLARTSTSTGSGGGSACLLPPNVYTQAFDANGNLLRDVYTSGGVPVLNTTNTIGATAAVCL